MVWDGIRTVHDQWGRPPTQMYPLNAILQIYVQADSLHVYPLDTWGRETAEYVSYLPMQPNLFEITLDQNQTPTLWFGIEKFGEGTPTAVSESAENLPHEFSLEQNYPNPFWTEARSRGAENPVTHIRFSIAAAGLVSLKVYDLHGREVAALVNEMMQPGRYDRVLEAHQLPASGVYFYRLQVTPRRADVPSRGKSFVETKKLLLIK
jgi:hypothetical protein